MGYETKVLLKSIYNYLDKCGSIDEAKEYVKDIANAEGVVVGAADGPVNGPVKKKRPKKKEESK